MTQVLIAKPVVKNQFWIVTNGTEKVGNVLAEGSGFEVKLNGNKQFYKNTSAIQKQTKIEFQHPGAPKVKQELPLSEYPTTKRVFNSIVDIKRKIHLFTKTQKSKCYHAAGWFVLKQSAEPEVIFCPKYIFVQRYPYSGPYKTEAEALSMINTHND
jgi:hypothetical protein